MIKKYLFEILLGVGMVISALVAMCFSAVIIWIAMFLYEFIIGL